MIMRISYKFTWGGKTFESFGVDIGETSNPKWYREDGGVGKRDFKWSAIFKELPEVCDAISTYYHDWYDELNPSDFGFRFQHLDESM